MYIGSVICFFFNSLELFYFDKTQETSWSSAPGASQHGRGKQAAVTTSGALV